MHKKLTQPKVDHYIHWLSRDDHFGMHGCVYDDKSDKLLDEFFELIDQIAPVSKNGVRALWLRAERGPIEDYGNAEEEVACGDFDSVEQFIEEWKAWFRMKSSGTSCRPFNSKTKDTELSCSGINMSSFRTNAESLPDFRMRFPSLSSG